MPSLPSQDQFHRMVELTMAARQAYKTMLENARLELAGEPGPPAPGSPPPQGPPAPAAGRDEPRYSECGGGGRGRRCAGTWRGEVGMVGMGGAPRTAARPPRGRARC